MSETRLKRWSGRALRLGRTLAIGGTALSIVATLALGYQYREQVLLNPGDHLERNHIRGIIAQESPVYYRDGTTRVGVFFEAEHRAYVSQQDLPLPWVMGIVGAEDGKFWSHFGIDVLGISRAMRDNLIAGKMVAGGSSLTQQTAKNIYYRPDRSIKSKLVELLNALRLEAHYEKGEILTFYANQFHVTGNGRGLGIGARHFFNKEVEDLSVAEAAFLAGLVKAPSRYDPFLGDDARRAKAVQAADGRTRYVLGRIVAVDVEKLVGERPPKGDTAAEADWQKKLMAGRAVKVEAQRLLDDGVNLEFHRGTFRYDASAVLDEVARRLAEPPFDDVLASAGIDDPATAGLQVVTTLDVGAQRAAIYGLWHHLTVVGIQMEKYGASDLIRSGRGPRYDAQRVPVVHEFRLATVTGEREVSGKRTLDVDLGGYSCHVDRAGLVRVAAAIVQGSKGNQYSKAQTANVNAVVDALPADSVVYVSVREVTADGPLCDLELTPELQGATMVMEQGEIRAMVGGNDNRNFNRATALRQMGSTWKPPVYPAAMQLGWSPEDELLNERQVFPFSTTFYYPRPDHSPAPVVSMSWAGVNSENLASIWMLYHLTDRLDGEQVRALAVSLDLAQRKGEDIKDYRTRIQKAGVLATRGRVKEGVFLRARREVVAGLDEGTSPGDALAVNSMLYGWNFDSERDRVSREGPEARAWKNRALDNSWRHLQPMMQPCAEQYRRLKRSYSRGLAPDALEVSDLSVLLDGEQVRVARGAIPSGYVMPDPDFFIELAGGGGAEALTDAAPSVDTQPKPAPRRGLKLRDWIPESVPGFGPKLTDRPDLATLDGVRMDDRVHLGTLRSLAGAIERRELSQSLATEQPELYSPEVLYWHQDFRVLLSLRYLSSLAEQYGVQTDIPPVLSLPLGATEITLEESVSVYGGITSGRSWTFPGATGGLTGKRLPSPSSPALLIAEVRDVDGNVLYRAAPESVEIAEPQIADMTSHILRNVVEYGTGRRATVIADGGRQIPVGGKTGTTNDFRNAAFMGYAPVWQDTGYSAVHGFAVGVYVGYDDNRSLVQGRIKLAGSSGALPAWMGTIEGLRDVGLLGTPSSDLQFEEGTTSWPLVVDADLVSLPVADKVGLLLDEPGPDAYAPGSPSVLTHETAEEPDVDYRPVQRPPRIHPRTDAPHERPPIIWWRQP